MKEFSSPKMSLVVALFLIAVLTAVAAGQGPAAPFAPKTHVGSPAQPGLKSGVDEVIELISSGASESMVITTLQEQGKPYNLSLSDLLKLRKAGVSENVIKVMRNPKVPVMDAANVPVVADLTPQGGGVTPSTVPPPAIVADAGAVTPFPPDLTNTPTARKRRVVIDTFRFGAAKEATPSRFDTTNDVGQGLRALLMTRLEKSQVITVLERSDALLKEQQMAKSSLLKRGTQVASGGILGADCIVTGDITTFGRDDKTSKKGGALGALVPGRMGRWGAAAGGFGVTSKEEKAVVDITLRLVDAETSTMLLSADARGESLRKSKSLGIEGLGAGGGGIAGGGFGSEMTSSGFQQTILGEATMDAIEKIAKQIEEKVPNLPQKPRGIEGRVADISTNGISLALGNNDGVLVGDRFEILQINNVVLDPQTGEQIDVEATKVGEAVVSDVHERRSIGAYGGQPLQAGYIKGKGYLARLMSK